MKYSISNNSLLFFALLLFSCEKEKTPSFDIKLSDTALGKVITDANAKTLYFFSNDAAGGSQCSGGCLNNWPVFYSANPTVSGDLNAADFKAITRADGTMQTTYKGWPLYYFASDVTAGDTKGENVNKVWFVAKPVYNLFVGNIQLVGHDGKKYKSDYTEGEGKTTYLMDSKGRTLYGFANDKKNKNNFTKSDFSNNSVWPIAEITDFSQIPSGFSASEFGVIDVFGKKQLTFRGWPLYYFGQDEEKLGVAKGVSFPRPGVWPIINTDTRILAE